MDDELDDKVDKRYLPLDEPASSPTKETGRRRGRHWSWIVTLVVVAVAAGLVFWYRPFSATVHNNIGFHSGRSARHHGAAGQPPQPVAVAEVKTGTIPIELNALGTVTSLATVTVRPQISGQLTEIGFKEGQEVRKGDFLAQIDDRAYRAALDQLQGQLARDQALLADAKRILERYQKLNSATVTQQQIDTQKATVESQQGTVQSDQAQIEAAKVNIAYCHIVAPIDGRVGLRQVDVGNYVTPGDTSGIVVITQIHPISVIFSIPENNLSEVTDELRAGHTLPVTLYGRDDQHEIATGTLQTVDNQIDVTTGTVKLRADFDNADEALFPNQFVNVRLLVRTLSDVPVVSDAAIQHGAPGTYVYVVNSDDTVSVRTIKTGASDASVTRIVSGLKLGDKVVVDGVDRLKEGAKVSIPAAGSAPAPAASAAKPGERHRSQGFGGKSGHQHRGAGSNTGGTSQSTGTGSNG
jgi:multidrug efflux system membrane fusion protein